MWNYVNFAPYLVMLLYQLLIYLLRNKKEQIFNSENINNYKIILFAWPLFNFFFYLALLLLFVFLIIYQFLAIVLMLVQGMISGAVGITFAHELMHQKTKFERFLSDLLMEWPYMAN